MCRDCQGCCNPAAAAAAAAAPSSLRCRTAVWRPLLAALLFLPAHCLCGYAPTTLPGATSSSAAAAACNPVAAAASRPTAAPILRRHPCWHFN